MRSKHLAGEKRGNDSHFTLRFGRVLLLQVKPEWKGVPNQALQAPQTPSTLSMHQYFYQPLNKTIQTWYYRMRSPLFQSVLAVGEWGRGVIPTPTALTPDSRVPTNSCCHLIWYHCSDEHMLVNKAAMEGQHPVYISLWDDSFTVLQQCRVCNHAKGQQFLLALLHLVRYCLGFKKIWCWYNPAEQSSSFLEIKSLT